MSNTYIVPLNLSKLGFRYFRIIFESKYFSKKFINYIVSHPNTGYVFEGTGWSGKKRILGVGIWATSNSEMSDIATNIRSVIPDSYKVVYQSELTRLEYFQITEEGRKRMVLLDELENKVDLSAVELDYLKLLSIDASLLEEDNASLLKIPLQTLRSMDARLKSQDIFYGCFPNIELPVGYTKFFIDTTAIKKELMNEFFSKLRIDENCIYIARGNGKYNVEIEYVITNEKVFMEKYSQYLKHSRRTVFDKNIYVNLFPHSKSLNTKMVQERFVELAKQSDTHFDLTDSELWYINHEGTKSYLDIYNNEQYKQAMKSGEVGLFEDLQEKTQTEGRFNLIDLGSGDGVKGRLVAESLGESNIKSYFPVDIQELELAQALYTHENATYSIHPTLVEFENLQTRFPIVSDDPKLTNLYLMFGGTYGNFDRREINSYLKDMLVNDKDRIIITMPIMDFKTKQEIEDSYMNKDVEGMSFGALEQIGFTRDDFVRNSKQPELRLQLEWVNGSLVSQFILARNKQIHGVYLDAGTMFSVTTSWKPNLASFREALEADFEVEHMLSNRSTAIAICKRASATL